MDIRETLDEIAIRHITDKSSNGHSYCQYYDMIFSKLRDSPINLLEIGIDKGASLLTWSEYFTNANIHGIDIRGEYEYLGKENIETHIVDHSSKGELILFGEQYKDYFDIIIEDGSHQSSDTILTFETLFPYLKSGGYYACEDLLCDFDNRWNIGSSSLERVRAMVFEVQMSGNIPNDSICANKKEAVKKYSGSYFDKNIEYIMVFCGLCIIKKI